MPPRNQARLAVEGDVVFGLASAAPPQPFVGEIGDPAAAAARGVTGRIKRSAGSDPSDGVKFTVNGRPVATTRSVANDLGPTDLVARPLQGVGKMRIGSQQCLGNGGAFQISPDASLKSLSLCQPVAHAEGVQVPADEGGDGATASGGGGGSSARSDYADPSALHRMMSRTTTGRQDDLVPPENRFLVGDPVDVATGAVVTHFVDFQRTVPPIEFRRDYTSLKSGVRGPLGYGWTHNFDSALWLEAGRVVLREGGRELEFDCLDLPDGVARAGDEILDATGRMRLRCHGRNHWELIRSEDIRHFTPLPGTSNQDRDRGFARLTKIIRRHLPLTELEYDDHARLYSVKVDGRSMFTLRYDQEERILGFSDGTVKFEYSPQGDLVKATDAQGHARSYEYLGHLLVCETNRRGGAFYYGYDGHGPKAKCLRTWGTGGRLHRVLSYETKATVVTDSLGHRTTYEMNAARLVTRVTDPLANSTHYSYDDALRLVRITYPDATQVSDSYDEAGYLVKRRERDGASWRMKYDHEGRLVEGFDPQGGRWRFVYDFDGRLTQVVDPLDHVTRLEYVNRQLERIVDPLGRVTEVRLGPDDEVLRVMPPGMEPVTFDYDARGRLVRARPDSSQETRWSYDLLGRPASVETGAKFVRFERDAEGSLTRIEREGRVWNLRRDSLGTLESVYNDDEHEDYDWDTEGRMVRAKCNGKSRLEVRRDERGLVNAFVVDGTTDGVVLREGMSDRISAMTKGDGLLEIEYDKAGRIRQFKDDDGTRRFAYRDDGLLTQFSSPKRACTVERNLCGVVIEQVQGEVVLASPHVDHQGRRYGLEVGEGRSISYLWSVDGELDRIAVAGENTFDLNLEHDDARHTAAVPDQSDRTASDQPTDALHRPLADAEGGALIWDEDDLLAEGNKLHVTDPRSGKLLATVDGDELSMHPELSPGVGRMLRAEEQAFADCFPLRVVSPKLEDRVPTPLGLLQQTFACRVWDPVVRPLPGALPWQPDEWHPEDEDPAPVPTRLEPATLMHLLSPFPRPLLR